MIQYKSFLLYTYLYYLLLIFFFNDTAPTKIYTLSLHDALPILETHEPGNKVGRGQIACGPHTGADGVGDGGALRSRERCGFGRSEEHTSELQSHVNLVCRLLLEKKKKRNNRTSVSNLRCDVLMS